MATLFDFFFRRPRPGLPVPPVPGEVIGERLVEEVDEALSTLNVPGELGEMLKKDLKEALDVKGAYRPGYEPGAVASVKFNLIDAVTNPLKTGGKIVDSFRGELKRPPVPLAWTDAEDDVWRYFFGTVWVDAQGYGVLPRSLESAVLRWNEKARLRVTRLAAETGIQKSPGLTLMMAGQLFKAGTTHVGGVGLTTIRADARAAERAVTRRLIDADAALRGGDQAGADKLWAEATDIQAGDLKFNPRTGDRDELNGVDWTKTAAFKSRGKVREEFERQIRLGSQKNAPQAAHTLANSPEAKFWRYWNNRNLYYFRTLNFLTTYRDKGLWGTAKIYAWDEFTKRAFAKGTWREYLYPPNFIQGKIVQPFAKKIRLTKLLDKLTDAKALFARTWKRLFKDPLTKGIELIRDKVVRKIVGWAAMKLGITGFGAALGSVLPGAGTALGAIISAIASFLVETAISKMGGVWRVAFVGVVGGVSLVFAILMAGGLGFVVLVSLIFNTNAVFPGAGGPGPAPAQVEVEKEVCPVDEFGQVLEDRCASWLKVPNPTVILQTVEWRVYVKNNTSDSVKIMVMDERCEKSKSITVEGEKRKFAFSCQETFPVGTKNTTKTNATEGTAPVGITVQWGTATLVIGEAPACTVTGVPYYCQCGQAYSGEKCKGMEKTVCEWGCGPTSEAMLINYHCGGTVTGPGEIAREYGCGAISRGATGDILGGGLGTGSFGSGDDFFNKIYSQLCAGRPVITTISHPKLRSGHISLIVGVDMARRKIILNDSYVSCVVNSKGAYAEYDFDEYRSWVNISTYWYWGGALHPMCNR